MGIRIIAGNEDFLQQPYGWNGEMVVIEKIFFKWRDFGSPRWLSAGAAPAASLKSRFARPGLSQPGLPKGTLQRYL
jgi:hypothetical protein